MMAGAVATQTGDAPYDFSAYAEVKLDFENNIYTVGGVAVALSTLLGGPHFEAGALSDQGLSVGYLNDPLNAPQAIGALFTAVRDGTVSGMTVVIEYKTKINESASNFYGPVLFGFFGTDIDYGNNVSLETYYANSVSALAIHGGGNANANANVPITFNGGLWQAQRQRLAGTFAHEANNDGYYIYSAAGNGQAAVAATVGQIQLPSLLTRVDLFALFEESNFPQEWQVLKFEVLKPVANAALASFSSLKPVAAVGNLGKNRTGQQTYSFDSFNLGSAVANRLVAVAIVGRSTATLSVSNNNPNRITTVTINGITADLVALIDSVEIWQAVVPTGTTGTVVVTWDYPQLHCSVRAWAFATDDVVPYDMRGGVDAAGADITIADLAVKNAGLTIAIARATASANGTAWSWSGSETLTTVDDYNMNGLDTVSVVQFTPASDSITCDLTLNAPTSATADVEVIAVSWKTGATAKDPFFASVKLLMGFDSTDGSTSFVDESAAPHTMTANGNAQIDNNTSWTGGAAFMVGTAAAKFDGSGDYISTPDSADWQLAAASTDEFTVEAWVFGNSDQADMHIVGQWNTTSSTVVATSAWSLNRKFADQLSFLFRNSSGLTQINAYPLTSLVPVEGLYNKWALCRVTRDSAGVISIYINGERITQSSPSSTSVIADAATPLTIGRNATSGGDFNGAIDELRITKGVARNKGLKKYYAAPVKYPRA